MYFDPCSMTGISEGLKIWGEEIWCGEHNLPTLFDIGLKTDLPKSPPPPYCVCDFIEDLSQTTHADKLHNVCRKPHSSLTVQCGMNRLDISRSILMAQFIIFVGGKDICMPCFDDEWWGRWLRDHSSITSAKRWVGSENGNFCLVTVCTMYLCGLGE